MGRVYISVMISDKVTRILKPKRKAALILVQNSYFHNSGDQYPLISLHVSSSPHDLSYMSK